MLTSVPVETLCLSLRPLQHYIQLRSNETLSAPREKPFRSDKEAIYHVLTSALRAMKIRGIKVQLKQMHLA